MRKKDLSVLMENENKMKSLYSPEPVGGALFTIKKAYIKSGMENENLYGWGNHKSPNFTYLFDFQ